MTAQTLIDEARYQVNDPSKEFYSDVELLAYLNAGVRFLSGELKLWSTSEDIELFADTDVYTVQGEIVQPIKCYDSLGLRRPINEQGYSFSENAISQTRIETLYGIDANTIYLINPKQIQVINPADDVILSLDYYYCPNAYGLTSNMTELNVSQIHMLTFYIAYRASLKVRGVANEFTIANKNTMQQLWLSELNAYKMQNPSTYFRDEMPNKLYEKGVL